MLYVSDHGESLGENNLYLHGLPYAMAPREQTHVPMLLWPATPEGWQADCLQRLREVDKVRGTQNLWQWFRGSRHSELLVVFGEDLAALGGLVLALGFIGVS